MEKTVEGMILRVNVVTLTSQHGIHIKRGRLDLYGAKACQEYRNLISDSIALNLFFDFSIQL